MNKPEGLPFDTHEHGLYIWSAPGPSVNPYIPPTRTGSWEDYMAENYPSYAGRGLWSWDDVLKYLQEKKDAVGLR